MSEKTYRIGEAAAKLNLKTYVLRFWETEFPHVAPIRTEKGQRLYTGTHLAILRRIRYLLHERGLTIEGARRLLREEEARGVAYDDSSTETFPSNMDLDALDEESAETQASEPTRTAGAPPELVQATLFPRQNDTLAPQARNQAFVDSVITELNAIKRILKPET